MGYPPQQGGWQQPQQGPPPGQYGPPPGQGGYGPPPGQGQQGPPPGAGGYGPPPGQYPPQQDGGQGWAVPEPDMDRMYEEGDPNASNGYTLGRWPFAVEDVTYGLTANGDKWMWTIRCRFTEGPNAGRLITAYRAITEYLEDGKPNTRGIAILYSELRALGVPVGPKYGDPEGTVGYWRQGPKVSNWPQQAFRNEDIGAAMVGRPGVIVVEKDRKDPERTRSGRIYPPAMAAGPPQGAPGPSAPPAQPGQPAPAMGGYQPGPPAQGYAQPGPQGGGQWPQQAQGGTAEFQPGTTSNPGQPPQQPWPGQPAAGPPGQYAQPPQQAAGPPAQAGPPGQPWPGNGAAPGQQEAQQAPPAGQPGGPPRQPWEQ